MTQPGKAVFDRLTPVYLLSLPRSGSTFVQRVLGAHDAISTVSEPWILLPYLYTLKRRGVYTEYSHGLVSSALEDFCRELPNGEADYLTEIRTFILRLYERASDESTKYFLDKTPRYHLIIEEILRVFPDAKYVFLWRNPLAIVASIMETWGNGHWNLYKWKVDLFDGLESLVSTFEKRSDLICSVRYEELVSGSDVEWKKLFQHLGLHFEPELLSRFGEVELRGQMGDSDGVEQYEQINTEPMDKWKNTLRNPVRKAWCRHYLRWIGEKRLAIMGYDLNNLIEEMDSIPASLDKTISDISRISFGIGFSCFEPYMMRDKFRLLPRWNRIHVHG